jgi:hypothetical protein
MDSDVLGVAGYLIVAVLASSIGWLERRRSDTCPDLRPATWFVIAGLFALMAVGRAGDVGQAIADAGRRGALSRGWYQSRRGFQEMLVVAVATCSVLLAVTLPTWTHERRRHYLPMVIATFGVMAFAAVRIVSLHQVDAVLRRPTLGSTLGTVTELSAIAIAIAVAIASWWMRPCRSTT